MMPTIGRIVHYHTGSGYDLAGIITRVYPEGGSVVDLTVFPFNNSPVVTPRVSEGEESSQWSWPVIER